MSSTGYDVTKWKALVRETMHRIRFGETEKNEVCEIWSDAIENALEECGTVEIPNIGKTIWLDRPIVLRSGNSVKVAKDQTIALLPGTDTCMIRNANLINGRERAVWQENPDCGISVEGGIWTTLSTTMWETNGNANMGADALHHTLGHGVMLFSNVRQLTVRNVRFFQCKSHAVQISNCEDFLCEDIEFIDHRRDGVHINGPAKNGRIRRLSGENMGDDMIALNAWDWYHTVVSFGTIENVVVEDVEAKNNEVRLLAGKKQYADGKTLDCDIRNCLFRNIRGIHAFKLYPQPNTEVPEEHDDSVTAGRIQNVTFENIVFEAKDHNEFCQKIACGLFHVGSDLCDATFRNIRLEGTKEEVKKRGIVLVKVGPLSYTHQITEDPSKWLEAFSPDRVCRAENLVFENVVLCGEKAKQGDDALLAEVRMQLNPEYPKTTPRGGTGFGSIGHVEVR